MDHRSVALCRDHRKLLHLRCGLSGDPGATPVGMTGCAAVQDELAPHTVCRGWQGPSPAVPWSGSCPWAVVPSPRRRHRPPGRWCPSVILPSLPPSAPSPAFLACRRRFCMAAASWPAFERWDGKRWSVVHTSNASVALQVNVSSVSCTSPEFCVAVGSTLDFHPWAMRWDGTRWSAMTIPGENEQLNGVDCLPADTCIAVGSQIVTASRSVALAERWDGRRWARMPAPTSGNGALFGLYCTSPTWCMAVGPYAAGDMSALWNGAKWSFGPVVVGLGRPGLESAVSCISDRACLALGESSPLPSPRLASWDGSRWSPVPSAYKNPPGDSAGLSGVSCYPTHGCFAVGLEGEVPNGSGCCRIPLMESWDGTKTSIVPQPASVHALSALSGVSCAPEGPCVAVGSNSEPPSARPLIEMS